MHGPGAFAETCRGVCWRSVVSLSCAWCASRHVYEDATGRILGCQGGRSRWRASLVELVNGSSGRAQFSVASIPSCQWVDAAHVFSTLYLLGVLAMIKCSICSHQCDN